MSRTISPSLLLRPAFPAQALITQGVPQMGQVYFKLMRLGPSNDRKTPCDTLSVGQADAGAYKGRKERAASIAGCSFLHRRNRFLSINETVSRRICLQFSSNIFGIPPDATHNIQRTLSAYDTGMFGGFCLKQYGRTVNFAGNVPYFFPPGPRPRSSSPGPGCRPQTCWRRYTAPH